MKIEGHDVDRAAPALLILDMFNLFDFDQGAALGRHALAITPAIARLRARFDQVGAPVIYVNDNFAHWQGEFSDLVARCAAADGPTARIAQALAPGEGHYYILKPKHSAFLATALPLLLAKLNVRALVLTGIAADSCILATAQDANMREYALWCPRDAIAAISDERKMRALDLMRSALGAATQSSRRAHSLLPATR